MNKLKQNTEVISEGNARRFSSCLECYSRLKGEDIYIFIYTQDTGEFRWMAAQKSLSLQGLEHQQLLQNFCLTCFSNFTSQKHFIHHCVHLVEIEHQI